MKRKRILACIKVYPPTNSSLLTRGESVTYSGTIWRPPTIDRVVKVDIFTNAIKSFMGHLLWQIWRTDHHFSHSRPYMASSGSETQAERYATKYLLLLCKTMKVVKTHEKARNCSDWKGPKANAMWSSEPDPFFFLAWSFY